MERPHLTPTVAKDKAAECLELAAAAVEGAATQEQLRAAIEAHKDWIKACKAGHGPQRHVTGLRLMADEDQVREGLLGDPSLEALSEDFLSTTSVGGAQSIVRYAFAPTSAAGFGIAYTKGEREFEFKPGPIFANIVIGDEINRASPKTQSAMLESMEERQVTVDGNSYSLANPFIVIATQNPIEMEGTYPLPEAQRDRFMARISMGYPDPTAELEMLRTRATSSPLDAVRPVVDSAQLADMIAAARAVYASRAVEQYAVAIANATREDRDLRLGASPRATLQLVRAAKARAALDGREFVLPDDIDALAIPVLGHRLIASRRAGAGTSVLSGGSIADIITRIVADTPVPISATS